jgi:RNA polymerase sigma-70 factor (ECF subfamily)
VAQLTDLDALEANAKRDNCNGSVRSDPPKPGLVEQSPHKEILALVPRLTRYARVLTRDPVAADDLVQDCIARALGKIHLWEPGTDLRAWLFTILHHQHVSLARRKARQHASIESQKPHRSSALAPNQTARLELRDLERAIAKLSEEQRSVILLVGLHGLGYDEAASVVGLPVGTVRSRVSRGREALRAMTGLFPGRYTPRRGKAAHRVSPPGTPSPQSQEVIQ